MLTVSYDDVAYQMELEAHEFRGIWSLSKQKWRQWPTII